MMMLLDKILLVLLPAASGLDLSFPKIFSATRVIHESSGVHTYQLGYIAHDYAQGLHMEARSVDNITYDEGIQHDHTQQAWTVWRDVQTMKESRPCETFPYHEPLAQTFLTDAKPNGTAVIDGIDCHVWTGTYQGPLQNNALVYTATSDREHVVRIVLDPESPTLWFDYSDWKTGREARRIELPKDCAHSSLVAEESLGQCTAEHETCGSSNTSAPPCCSSDSAPLICTVLPRCMSGPAPPPGSRCGVNVPQSECHTCEGPAAPPSPPGCVQRAGAPCSDEKPCCNHANRCPTFMMCESVGGGEKTCRIIPPP